MKDQLQPGEEIVFVARPSKIVLIPLGLLFLALVGGFGTLWVRTGETMYLVVLAVAGALLLLRLVQRMMMLASHRYVLTDRRVVRNIGIISQRSVDSYLDKINNVEHRQSVWGRVFGYGDVLVDTASESGITLFPMIARPLEFKNAVVNAMEQYRASRFGGAARPLPPSGAEKIRELKALLDEKLISDEEFEAKRKQLLTEL